MTDKLAGAAEREKLCWFCKHLYYSNASPDYSEMTPGNDFAMDCIKSHWKFDAFETNQIEFFHIINTAKTCEDFVVAEHLK
jgi:hypothetical protein